MTHKISARRIGIENDLTYANNLVLLNVGGKLAIGSIAHEDFIFDVKEHIDRHLGEHTMLPLDSFLLREGTDWVRYKVVTDVAMAGLAGGLSVKSLKSSVLQEFEFDLYDGDAGVLFEKAMYRIYAKGGYVCISMTTNYGNGELHWKSYDDKSYKYLRLEKQHIDKFKEVLKQDLSYADMRAAMQACYDALPEQLEKQKLQAFRAKVSSLSLKEQLAEVGMTDAWLKAESTKGVDVSLLQNTDFLEALFDKKIQLYQLEYSEDSQCLVRYRGSAMIDRVVIESISYGEDKEPIRYYYGDVKFLVKGYERPHISNEGYGLTNAYRKLVLSVLPKSHPNFMALYNHPDRIVAIKTLLMPVGKAMLWWYKDEARYIVIGADDVRRAFCLIELDDSIKYKEQNVVIQCNDTLPKTVQYGDMLWFPMGYRYTYRKEFKQFSGTLIGQAWWYDKDSIQVLTLFSDGYIHYVKGSSHTENDLHLFKNEYAHSYLSDIVTGLMEKHGLFQMVVAALPTLLP